MPRPTNRNQTRPRSQNLPGSAAPAAGAGRAALLTLLVVAMAAAVVALVVRGLDVASTLPSTRVETYLELPVLAGGALAAAWVGVSSLVALVCVAARSAGRTWSRGEHLVARHAPAVVRRAARIGVSVSVGAGLVLGGGSAHAAAPDVTDDTATVGVVDLGWRPSAPQVTPGDTNASEASEASSTANSPERVEPAVPADGADTDGADTDGADTDGADTDGPGADGPGAVGTAEPDRSDGSATADRETTSASAAEAPATAPTGTPAPGTSTPVTPSGASSGAPDRLPAAERDAVLAVTRDVPAPAGEVVVLRGDTLWGIAARTLPADATDAAVAAEVQRWYAANQDTIGADPDLIRPGQVLVAPTA